MKRVCLKNKVKDLIEEYNFEKKKIKFFDANCWLGAPISESLIKIPETVDELLDAMDYYGIERSVVCSSLALNYNVVYGNEKLLKEINKNDRLYAGAILLPEHTNEFGNISNYISFLINNKVVLVKLFPKIHIYDNRIFYPLLKKHKNLFIETHNITNYLGLDDIVKQFTAKKVLFGTFIPENDPEASLMPIIYGDFSFEEKQIIAGNNLLSLISNIKK